MNFGVICVKCVTNLLLCAGEKLLLLEHVKGKLVEEGLGKCVKASTLYICVVRTLCVCVCVCAVCVYFYY